MEWVIDFYDKQELWSGCYTGGVTDYHRKKVEFMEENSSSKNMTVLELGAGGGQFTIAAAQKGHSVTAIELNKRLNQHGKSLAEASSVTNATFITDSFYNVELNERFDAICYWDGFGVGTDHDQRVLLKRISKWLNPEGKAFIDIYTPWFWSKASGVHMSSSTYERQYEYDVHGSRMLDHWWSKTQQNERVTQSLRCYSPVDLDLLLEGTGLKIETIESGSSMKYGTMEFIEKAPLNEAMSYTVVLTLTEK